jgi:hypothetical protein
MEMVRSAAARIVSSRISSGSGGDVEDTPPLAKVPEVVEADALERAA